MWKYFFYSYFKSLYWFYNIPFIYLICLNYSICDVIMKYKIFTIPLKSKSELCVLVILFQFHMSLISVPDERLATVPTPTILLSLENKLSLPMLLQSAPAKWETPSFVNVEREGAPTGNLLIENEALKVCSQLTRQSPLGFRAFVCLTLALHNFCLTSVNSWKLTCLFDPRLKVALVP